MDMTMNAPTGGVARKTSGCGWRSRRRVRRDSVSVKPKFARFARVEGFRKSETGTGHEWSTPELPTNEVLTTTTEVELTGQQGVRVPPGIMKLVLVVFLILNGRLPPNTDKPQASLTSSLAHALSIAAVICAVGVLSVLGVTKKQMPHKQNVDMKKVMGAALLVAGGTVGAGIVALPVKTAAVGLLPSVAGLLGGWAFMLTSAFVIVHVSERHDPGANFTSMAERTLGKKWKAVSAALYIFVYCATLTAYIAESATFLGPAAAMVMGWTPPTAVLSLFFTGVFSGVIALGSKAVDTVNSLCVTVALAAFLLLMVLGTSSLDLAALLYCQWSKAIRTAPIMVVAFTFHNMVPSLFGYLRSGVAVRRALLVGTAIPLTMYVLWELLILGSLPPGSTPASVGEIVGQMGGTGAVPAAINVFSLFAIITSFLGVGMGCLDFILDPAGRSGKSESRPAALAVMMGLPLSIASFCPQLFVAALEVSGVLRLVLFAIIPALMLGAGKPKGNKGWLGVVVITLAMVVIGIDVVGRLTTFMG